MFCDEKALEEKTFKTSNNSQIEDPELFEEQTLQFTSQKKKVV